MFVAESIRNSFLKEEFEYCRIWCTIENHGYDVRLTLSPLSFTRMTSFRVGVFNPAVPAKDYYYLSVRRDLSPEAVFLPAKGYMKAL